MSRSVYESFESPSGSDSNYGGGGEDAALLFLFALPLIVDIVALPVTIPHDLVTLH